MGSKPHLGKTAVVLLNLGGPLSLEAVEPFLFSLFSDPAILTLPQPFRGLLARFISKRRLSTAQDIYRHLGGCSPLLENTQAQAQALEKLLGEGYKVFVAMRHAPPLTQEVAREVRAYDPQRIVLLPLYPQYSTTTTGSSFQVWEPEMKSWKERTVLISEYPNNEGFLEALKQNFLPAYRDAQKAGSPKVLLTAHGLPQKTIRKGDPYQRQVETTAQAFLEKLDLPSLEVQLCYQSRVGPLAWIGPSTEDEVVKASRDKRPLVVVPISFVSEHSETLVELDIEYRDLALEKGCPTYHRVETVQTHPAFIRGLSTLVLEALHSEGRPL